MGLIQLKGQQAPNHSAPLALMEIHRISYIHKLRTFKCLQIRLKGKYEISNVSDSLEVICIYNTGVALKLRGPPFSTLCAFKAATDIF